MLRFIFAALLISMSQYSFSSFAGVVEFKEHMIFVDGESQPLLFGGELQYFRMRGGVEKNIPRQKVIDLWNKALDHLVEMSANSISISIPWDFHEYAIGKFDFDGTVDEDADGNPDYPSRDLKTFFQLIEAHGIRHIMVRPGPYIKADWGFSGYGAIPLWFHEKYPSSHMQNPQGLRTPFYTFNDPRFLAHTKLWFEALHKNVLVNLIGEGKPISFIQIDHESLFQSTAIFTQDYSTRSINAYRDFLSQTYTSIENLNKAHSKNWKNWSDVTPPTQLGASLVENQDWYRYQEQTLHAYHSDLRKIWESLGVKEPHVLFTLSDSYNTRENGVLPNYKLQNNRSTTGLLGVNFYPQLANTSGPDAGSVFLDTPFKIDHDIIAVNSANDYYLGSNQDWVMGPEVQGGWWKENGVGDDARAQSYLSSLGHGMKALFVYSFTEGDSWQADWAFKQVQIYFDQLKETPKYSSTPVNQLPDGFWLELDSLFESKVFVGWNTKSIYMDGGLKGKELYFDTPLDANGDTRKHFDVLKEIGAKIVEPYGRFLSSATELNDPVCILKDDSSNVVTNFTNSSTLSSTFINSSLEAALVGYVMQTGINPKILHWGINAANELNSCKLIVHQDTSFNSIALIEAVTNYVLNGGALLNILSDDLTRKISSSTPNPKCDSFEDSSIDLVGKKCGLQKGVYYQISKALYERLNSREYAKLNDVSKRTSFITNILSDLKIEPQIKVLGTDRVVAFARVGPDQKKIVVTIKNGKGQSAPCRVVWSGAESSQGYAVSRLMEDGFAQISGKDLASKGFIAGLRPHGSDMFFIEPVGPPPEH